MWCLFIFFSLCVLLVSGCEQAGPVTVHAPVISGAGAAPLPDPLETVDVLVVGSGPAGLSAAWSAREAGASVRVLELSDFAGGAGFYAGNFFAAETQAQTDWGVSDSVEAALADWPTCTGGDGDDPRVVAFVEGSADNLRWLMDEFGAEVRGLSADISTCDKMRVHAMRVEDSFIVTRIAETLPDEILLSTRAETLLQDDDGAVAGVWITDLVSGEQGWIQAGATVVASGGFARDVERLLEDRPELADLEYVVESAPTSDGLGHALLEPVGADVHNAGANGIYMHATPDHRTGFEGEALILTATRYALIVNGEGERVANEEEVAGFGMFDHAMASPSRRLLALWPQDVFSMQDISVPGYNAETRGANENLDSSELVEAGSARIYDTIDDVAAGEGIDLDPLSRTFLRYVELVAAGQDDDFGKGAELLESFEDQPLVVTDLTPGASKAFGGVRTDVDGRALDGDGEPVPGLFAGGEVTGMLGTEAVGRGFSGSVAACYWSGRVAGATAASAALAR